MWRFLWMHNRRVAERPTTPRRTPWSCPCTVATDTCRCGTRADRAPLRRRRSDTEAMSIIAERYHWLNTIAGILDQAFHLTDDEQVGVITIVGDLLDYLDIPGRGDPAHLPTPVASEVSAGLYSTQLSGASMQGFVRPVRRAVDGEIIASVETWREALLGLLTAAYPDLEPSSRLYASTVFANTLIALGLPARAANFFPDEVTRQYRSIDM